MSKRILVRSRINLRSDPTLGIKKVISKACDVKLNLLSDRRRGRENITWARHLAMYFSYLCGVGNAREVAFWFGRLDRGTVTNALKRVRAIVTIPYGAKEEKLKRQYRLCHRKVSKLFGWAVQDSLIQTQAAQ